MAIALRSNHGAPSGGFYPGANRDGSWREPGWRSLRDRTLLIRPGDYLPHVRFAAVFAFGEPTNNGANRIRTGDPLLAKQVLYQLSYGPVDDQ